MEIEFFNHQKYKINVKNLGLKVQEITKKLKLGGYIGINIVDDNQIQRLNKKYRSIDKVTDVLSFSTITQDKNQIFGDIIISPEYAKKHNEKAVDLIIHGIIHLMGYDHNTNKQEKEWKKVLKKTENGYKKTEISKEIGKNK